MYHPWRVLRALEHIRLKHAELPLGVLGYTNGVDLIVLDKFLLQVERRCTLTHELVHVEMGHETCQSEAIEKRVSAEASRRLITLEHLLLHIPWANNLNELADDLWVTPDVLADRIACLTPSEWAQIRELETQEGW